MTTTSGTAGPLDPTTAALEATLTSGITDLEPVSGTVSPAGRQPTKFRRRAGRVGFWLAVGWLAFVAFVAIFANVLPLHPYDQFVDHLEPRTGIGLRMPEPLGTDTIGRSMASRLALGARQSLLVGVASIGIAVVVAGVVGSLMGYLRGWVDATLGIVLDAILAFPPLILLLAIASIGARNLSTVIFSLSLLLIAPFSRLIRANTLSLADREFVIAARAMGASQRRIMFREIFPNVIPSLISVVFLFMAEMIIAEGSLSFLGFGIPPPAPSWGGMVNEGRQFLSTAPQLVFIPAACLLFTVVAFRTVGERIRLRYAGGGGLNTL